MDVFPNRPVVTEPEQFFTQVIDGDEYLWTGGYLNERFPQPVSPLGWSVVGGLTEELAFRDPLRYLGYRDVEQLPLTKLYGGHPYTNVAVFQILFKVFPAALVPDDATRFFPDGDVGLRMQAPYPSCLLDPRFILSMLRHFVREPANWSPLHNYRHWVRFETRHEPGMAALARRLELAADLGDMWGVVEAAQRWNRDLLGIHRWSLMAAGLTVRVLGRLVARWVSPERQPELTARLLAGLPNRSLELDQALRALAPTAKPGALDVGEFLRQYGHRSFSLDLYQPTFADDPEQVLRLREIAGQDPDPAARTAEREAAEREVRAAVASGSLGRCRILAFNRALALARRYVVLREDQRFAWQRTLALMRRAFLRIGESLAAAGLLAEADDVFFTALPEVADLVRCYGQESGLVSDLRRVAAARHAAFSEIQRKSRLAPHQAPPAFLRGNRPLEARREGEAQCWRGVPVSPGVASGPVRLVLTPGQFDRILPGDILVTLSTDPGWTPVFGRLAGLVMERGGLLSHGSVVAREYGLPAVVGIPRITEHLNDGDLVFLDGRNGTVALESRCTDR